MNIDLCHLISPACFLFPSPFLCPGNCQPSCTEGKFSPGTRCSSLWCEIDLSRLEAGAYASSLFAQTLGLHAELPGLISLTTVLSKCNHLWLCTCGSRSSRNCCAIHSAPPLTREGSALLCMGRGTSMRFCQKAEPADSEEVLPHIFVGLII